MRSIITRVLVAVLTVITAFSLALAYNTSEQRRLIAQMARVNQSFVPIARQLDGLEEEVRSFGRILSNTDPAALRQSIRASMTLFPFADRVETSLDALRTHLDTMLAEELSDSERAFASNVRLVADELSAENIELARLTADLLRQLDEAPPGAESFYGELGTRVIAFERRVDGLARIVDGRTDAALISVREEERAMLMRVVAVSACATLFALFIVLVIGRSLAPIRALTALASRFKLGDYNHDPIDAGNDEIGTLAREFSGMAEAIQQRDGILRQQKTELEQAYEALVVAQRAQVQAERLAAVGEIAARVTHELRNPLSSIGLNVEMLGDELQSLPDTEESEEARIMLGAIEREVARLTDLTERYLSMARSDEPRRERSDLVELTQEVLDQQRAALTKLGIDTAFTAPESLAAAVDPPQIRQVLINLLRNAAQATETLSAREISVLLHDADQHVEIIVEDNGPGIDPEILDRLFEPFVTGKSNGTGLGLSISRSIARKHGGDLTAGPGEQLSGARFTLTLPRS